MFELNKKFFGGKDTYAWVRDPGILTIWRTFKMSCANTHSTQDKWLFCLELQPHRQRIPRKKVYSARNYQLRDKEFTWEMGFCRELTAHRRWFHSSRVSSETRFAFCFAKLDAKRVSLFRETNWLFHEISCFAKQPVLHVSLFLVRSSYLRDNQRWAVR
jgi:hypothetical protein